MLEFVLCFSFHHFSYCMGHRFQARQQNIEIGQEGVFVGIGKQLIPLFMHRIMGMGHYIKSSQRMGDSDLCSGSQRLQQGVFHGLP
jgi:hypothetical protein